MAQTKITIEGYIDTDKLPSYMAWFLKAQPMPQVPVLDGEGNETLDENGLLVTEDKYTFMQWLKLRIRNYVTGEMSQGKAITDRENAESITIDTELG